MVSIPRFQPQLTPHPRRRAVCWLLVALLIPTSATAADPRPSPHRHIPAKNLIAYFEFDGLDAHAEAWKATAAHAALNKTKAGAMISELVRQGAQALIEEYVPFVTGADVVALHEHLIRHGFTIAIHSLGRDAFSATFVINDLGNKELIPTRKNLKRLFNFFGLPTPTRTKGRDLYMFEDSDEPAERQMDDEPFPLSFLKKPANDNVTRPAAPWMTSWFEHNDLLIVVGPSDLYGDAADHGANKTLAEIHKNFVAAILDTTDGKQPNVETHPSYRGAVNDHKDLKGFEPAGVFFMSPTDDKGLITALLRYADGLDDRAVQPAPPDPGRTEALPGRTAPVDEEIRRASAETESLPPVFTEKDRQFLNRDVAIAISAPATKSEPVENEDSFFTAARINALDLSGLKRVAGSFGFQGEAFLTDLRIETPSPRTGLSTCFDQPVFNKFQLPPLPRGVASFAVGSLDFDKTYGQLVEIGKALDYSLGEDLHQFEKIVRDETNVRFREDLLKHLGSTWCIYQSPLGSGSREPGKKPDPTDYVLLAGVKDAAAFSKVLDTMASYINENDGFLEPAQTPVVEKLPAPATGYRLTARAAATLELDDGVQPTIFVGKSFIGLAATPEQAQEALAAETHVERRWKPTGKLVSAFQGLPENLTFLAVADHSGSSIPDKIGALPHMTQMIINMSQEDDLDNASPWCILDLIGVPRPGGFHVKIDRSQIPRGDDLRPFLFPSVLAATVDERGYRLISRGAFPFALLGNETEIKSWFGAGWTVEEGFRFKEKINFTIFGLDPTEW